MCSGVDLPINPSGAYCSGNYYYEIYVLTEGLVQAGWCGSDHGCDESQENGVGDSETSWSFGRNDERVT